MKPIVINLILIIMITVLLFTACTSKNEDFSLYDTSTGRIVTLSKMASSLADYDLVIFGEFHGNKMIHSIQADLLPLYLKYGQNIAISMEMFERDVQSVLDSYLEGNIGEEDFILQARAWPNYLPDYKPLLDFAQSEELYVIAANVPRRYAALVNRDGLSSLEKIPEEEREFLAKEVIITDDLYKQKFYDTMLSSPHLSSMDSEMLDLRLFNLYAAQSLKDDTMAESVVNLITELPGTKIIHFTGDFHSRGRLGMVTKINELNPDLKIATISPEIVRKEEQFTYNSAMRNIADFIVVIRDADSNE